MPRSATVLPLHIVAQLGQKSDSDLAKEAGVSTYIISSARTRRNVAAPTSTPTPVVIPDSIKRAFRKAKVGAEGMVIPFDIFAAAAPDALK